MKTPGKSLSRKYILALLLGSLLGGVVGAALYEYHHFEAVAKDPFYDEMEAAFGYLLCYVLLSSFIGFVVTACYIGVKKWFLHK